MFFSGLSCTHLSGVELSPNDRLLKEICLGRSKIAFLYRSLIVFCSNEMMMCELIEIMPEGERGNSFGSVTLALIGQSCHC